MILVTSSSVPNSPAADALPTPSPFVSSTRIQQSTPRRARRRRSNDRPVARGDQHGRAAAGPAKGVQAGHHARVGAEPAQAAEHGAPPFIGRPEVVHPDEPGHFRSLHPASILFNMARDQGPVILIAAKLDGGRNSASTSSAASTHRPRGGSPGRPRPRPRSPGGLPPSPLEHVEGRREACVAAVELRRDGRSPVSSRGATAPRRVHQRAYPRQLHRRAPLGHGADADAEPSPGAQGTGDRDVADRPCLGGSGNAGGRNVVHRGARASSAGTAPPSGGHSACASSASAGPRARGRERTRSSGPRDAARSLPAPSSSCSSSPTRRRRGAFVGKEELERMRGALLLNAGRGRSIDTDQLVSALQGRQGAGRGPGRHGSRAAARRPPSLEPSQRHHHAALRRRAPGVRRGSVLRVLPESRTVDPRRAPHARRGQERRATDAPGDRREKDSRRHQRLFVRRLGRAVLPAGMRHAGTFCSCMRGSSRWWS